MTCPFVVGQKVVCIEDFSFHAAMHRIFYNVDICPYPKVNDIVKIDDFAILENFVFLKLEGYNPKTAFFLASFRPLQTKPTETDISVFEKLLDKTKAPTTTKIPERVP